MTDKQKALKLANELGLTIHKVRASYVTGAPHIFYYIIADHRSVAWDDFRERPNPTKYFTYLNDVEKHMIRDSWADCIDGLNEAKKAA